MLKKQTILFFAIFSILFLFSSILFITPLVNAQLSSNINDFSSNLVNEKVKNCFNENDLSKVKNCINTVKYRTNFQLKSNDVYVSPTGNDDTGDGNKDNPYATIKKALNSVTDKGTIHLLNGKYSESNVLINKDIAIIGENQSETVLINQNQNRIFTISKDCTITIENLTFTNASNAIYNDHSDINIFYCNFTNNSASYEAGRGGAIYNEGGGVNIDHCSFSYNTANTKKGSGGAIYNEHGDVHLDHSNFTDNTANFRGGTIFNVGVLNADYCSFTNNTASNGGAIYTDFQGINIYHCSFTNNTATDGGAIYNGYYRMNAHFSSFVDNKASKGNAISSNVDSDFKYNWWGSNNDPSSEIWGDITFTPWIYMDLKVNSTMVRCLDKVNVTVDFNNAYDGSRIVPTEDHIPDMTTVNFSSTLGFFNPNPFKIVNGTAKTIFKATNAGSDDIKATTDNQTLSKNITVTPTPTSIIVNNITANNGQTITIRAKLTSNNEILPGKYLVFIVNGKVLKAQTDKYGIASVKYHITEKGGRYAMITTFSGDMNYLKTFNTCTLYIPQTNLISTITGRANSLKRNQKFTLIYTIINKGPDSANNTIITIHLPKYYILTNINNRNWKYNKKAHTLTQKINSFAKKTIQIRITGKITRKGIWNTYSTIQTSTYNTQKNQMKKIKIKSIKK